MSDDRRLHPHDSKRNSGSDVDGPTHTKQLLNSLCIVYFKLESNLPLILTSYNRTLFTPVCGRDRFIYHNHKTQHEVLAVTRIECALNYINLYDHSLRTRRPAYKYMGGADLSDQNIKYYSVMRKSKKWWMKLFFFFFNLILTNSYALYRKF